MKLEEALPFLREGKGITSSDRRHYCFILDKNGWLMRRYLKDIEHSFIRAGYIESSYLPGHGVWNDDWEVIDDNQ